MKQDEVTEHGDEAEEAQTSHDVDYGVLQIKFPWTAGIRRADDWLKGLAE